MGNGLRPLSIEELYAHSLVVERLAALRFRTGSRLVRELGHHQLANALSEIGEQEAEQIRTIERGSTGKRLPVLAAGEAIVHFQDSSALPREPESAEEVLELALEAERRAESFYSDVAASAVDPTVRALAAEMAIDERMHVERLEHLLGEASALPDETLLRATQRGAARSGASAPAK
jgi:bacterioferritin (cytochrome b1)